MKKLSLLLIGLLLIPSLLLTSCDRGDEPGDIVVITTPEFTLLKAHMVTNDLDIDKILTNSEGKFVKPAPATAAEIPAFLDEYYIIDIRSNDHFNTLGHIQGAKNVAFSDILVEAPNAGTKPILIVCYSGQTACYATALLRMYGYPKTFALKWGMSSWNETTAAGSWDKKIGVEEAKNHANWSNSSAPVNFKFDEPTITTNLNDGGEILKKRVEEVVAAGFGAATVPGLDVLETPGNYFVNNYFKETDFAGFGHIANAYRIFPLTLAGDEYRNLNPDPDAKVVTYCYTGQTSAVMTACLRVLGYDAYTMLYGMNGIYNTNPAFTSNQWGVDSNHKDYTLSY